MVDIATAAALLGVGAQHVRRLCAAGKLAGAVKRDGGWRIPRAADARLSAVKGPEQLSAALDTAAIAKPKLDQAVWRRGLIEQAEAFCAAAVKTGGDRTGALAAFCRQADVPVRTLQRWMQRWKDKGLAGLVDNRGRGDSFGPVISPGAWDEFLSLYLVLQQPTVKSCWMTIGFINRQQNRGWTIPSLRTMQDYVTRHIPYPVLVLHREGQGAYDAKCAPYIETDLEAVEPGAVWIGDHHQCDFWVLDPSGQWIRPWLTVWEDMRSRAIVGLKVTTSPNSTTILQAFRSGVETYGPPEAVKIDNGKDYDSEMWTGTTKVRRRITKKLQLDEPLCAGLYAMMEIAVSFAIPYHAQAKAIERWFATLESQYGKTVETYCGPDTTRRPEDIGDKLASRAVRDRAMSWSDFCESIQQYAAVYNKTAHTGRGMNGQSPMQVMSRRVSRRVMTDGAMDLLLRNWTGELTVGKNGVTVKGLTYGKYDAALLMHQGRKVRCSYDAEDMRQVQVYDANSYALITIAEQSELVGYGAAASETDLRQAMADKSRARKAVRAYKPAARVAAMNRTDLMIAAMQQRTAEVTGPDSPATIKPVATAMDQNIKLTRRLVNQKKVRQAAGAEGLSHVVELTLDTERPTAAPDGPSLSLEFGRRGTNKKGPTLTLLDD